MENACPIDNAESSCFKFPLKRIQWQDTELGHTYHIELHVYNTAGHYLRVKSPEFKVPSGFPPGHGTVVDVKPGAGEDTSDIDFVTFSDIICGVWNGFWHHMDVTFEVGVGTLNGKDDVISFGVVNSTQSACVKATHITPFTKYFFVVRATCSGGSTTVSSDGFVLVNEKLLRGHMHVVNGKRCVNGSEVVMPIVNSTFSSTCNLNPEKIYTVKMNCSGIEIESSEVIWLQPNVFIPSAAVPMFSVVGNSDVLNKTCQASIYTCYENISFSHGAKDASGFWTLESNILYYVTSFSVAVFDTAINKTVMQYENIGRQTQYTTSNVTLIKGHEYKLAVIPCFGSVCLEQVFSRGFIADSDPIPSSTLHFTMQSSGDFVDVGFEFSCFSCATGATASGYDIAVFSSEDRRRQLSAWHVVRGQN